MDYSGFTRNFVFVLASIFLVAAGCSSSDGPGEDAGVDAGTDAGSPDGDGDPSPDGADDGADTQTDAGEDAGEDAYDAGTDTGGDEEGDLDPNPFEEAEQNPGEWVWIPVEGTSCRDGSPTGMGVRLQEGADKLVIYLEGGGACFSILTCALYNPDHFSEEDFFRAIWDYQNRERRFGKVASHS